MGLATEQLSGRWAGINYSNARTLTNETWRGWLSERHIFTQAALTPGIAAVPARPPHPPPGPPGTGPAVTFARSALTVPWHPDHGTLLELAEACDVPARWSCRTGVCHNCETGLLSGAVAYAPDPVEPPAEGNTLICSARPLGPVVLDM